MAMEVLENIVEAEADEAEDEARSASGSTVRSRFSRAYIAKYRRQIVCLVAFCAVVVYLFAFLVVGVTLDAKRDNDDGSSSTADDVAAASASSSEPVIAISIEQEMASEQKRGGDAPDDGDDAAAVFSTLGAAAEPAPGLRSTRVPSAPPSRADSAGPSFSPSEGPAAAITEPPRSPPSKHPTPFPSGHPTDGPSKASTGRPTFRPTFRPSESPSETNVWTINVTSWINAFHALTLDLAAPKATPNPTKSPSERPTKEPTSSSADAFDATDWIEAFHSLQRLCLTHEECDEQRRRMGFWYYVVDDHLMKGCFYKNDVAYFGLGGTFEEMSSPSQGQKMRIWCGDVPTETIQPTERPSSRSTPQPSSRPSPAPSKRPVDPDASPCFTLDTYDRIDDDVERLKNEIADPKARSHFLGGIVRLAAHDFMDYDRFDAQNPMGPDGCFDANHAANAGLPEDIWCANCTLTLLYEQSYSHLVSRADFWIAAANAVIRQTSIDGALDLADTFRWGREDAESCTGSGERLPSPTGCADFEDVFLRRMGLGWKDAVALMGAHTLGRGGEEFSGHDGTWVDTDEDAQVFDKQYYEEIYLNSWRPRNAGQSNQDWTTGRPSDGGNTRMMLNTDICLVHDIDDGTNLPCCTGTGRSYPNGQDMCVDDDAARRRCPMYGRSHSRFEASVAVGEMLGGPYPNANNGPFYDAFAEAWGRATTAGREGLMPLAVGCEPLR